jgi:hypothetical protein
LSKVALSLASSQRDGSFLRTISFVAEGEGFEPPVRFPVQWFSRPPVSTAHASLRATDWQTRPSPQSLVRLILQRVGTGYARFGTRTRNTMAKTCARRSSRRELARAPLRQVPNLVAEARVRSCWRSRIKCKDLVTVRSPCIPAAGRNVKFSLKFHRYFRSGMKYERVGLPSTFRRCGSHWPLADAPVPPAKTCLDALGCLGVWSDPPCIMQSNSWPS